MRFAQHALLTSDEGRIVLMNTGLRRALPVVGARGTGSHDTCTYQCGNACAQEAPNRSDNPTFGDVVAQALSRRGFLKAGLSASVVVGTSGVLGAVPAAAATGERGLLGRAGNADLLTFTPIEPTTIDDVVVPETYGYHVLLRWGDPILPGAAAFDFENQTPQAQAEQFGYNCDYVAYFPFSAGVYAEEPNPGALRRHSLRGLLVVNHEYTNPELMFRDYRPLVDPADPEGPRQPPTREQVDIEMNAHGLSVVEIRRNLRTRHFGYVQNRWNRRITAFTPMELTGPAAGDDLLKTTEDPTGTTVLGTLNNCAGGVTPWGTVLTGEENFDQYFSLFDASVLPPEVEEAHLRYGLSTVDAADTDQENAYQSQRAWELYHRRFSVRDEPNEPFRFGWIVEIDPFDFNFVPRKRTALGRMKHEGAECSLTADGRVVAYLGDDERFDYLYKFVSDGHFVEGDKQHNLGLLDAGTLYVARFTGDSPPAEIDGSGTLPADGEFDGGGEWIKLVAGDQSFVPGFTAAQVLINTRLAADAVGATKMDRPEDVQRNPTTGRVYVNLTNNTRRTPEQVDEANPRSLFAPDDAGVLENVGNPFGHTIELEEAGGDAAAASFAWRIFLQCGDPADPSTYFAGFPRDQVSPIATPDNMTFDQAGNLWLGTDGQGSSIGLNDAFHAVPTEGPERGHVKQFLSTPVGAEACGPCFTPDQLTLFCAVQHPGEDGTIDGEGQVSDWPDRGGRPPRPSVVDIARHIRLGDRRIGA
jgi:secreted PhoX family phosphatase